MRQLFAERLGGCRTDRRGRAFREEVRSPGAEEPPDAQGPAKGLGPRRQVSANEALPQLLRIRHDALALRTARPALRPHFLPVDQSRLSNPPGPGFPLPLARRGANLFFHTSCGQYFKGVESHLESLLKMQIVVSWV